jgi:hypothetical protein
MKLITDIFLQLLLVFLVPKTFYAKGVYVGYVNKIELPLLLNSVKIKRRMELNFFHVFRISASNKIQKHPPPPIPLDKGLGGHSN